MYILCRFHRNKKKISHIGTLNNEALQILSCEVEAIVNGRPANKISSYPRDLEALPPNHVLLFKTNTTLPPGLFTKEDIYARRRGRPIQYLAEMFWYR